jgi:hypothetical protein
MKRRLKDVDSAERVMLLRIVLWVGGPMFFVTLFIQWILFGTLLIWLIPDLLLAALVVWAVFRGTSGAGTLVNSLLMPTGTPPMREYSEQQALVARGLIGDAVDSYRNLIVAFPEDLDARLRLGALLAGPAGDVITAEQVLVDARACGPTADQERVIGNALIDLYRSSGRRAELKSELARFARLNHRHHAGAAARTYLQELIREESTPGLSE